MQSVDTLLSASLRVSRPVAACSRCRLAKIKCDGKLPACTACERSGKAHNCSGTNDEFAKGKERSYVGALETTLANLQKRLAQLQALQTPSPSRRDEIAACTVLGPGYDLSPPSTAGHVRVNRKEASDIDNLVGDFGFLSVNATSRDFHGFTSTMSFARLLLAVSKTGELSQADAMDLPARYTVTSLLQGYLEEVFVLMPFFSETDLMASVTAIYSHSGRHAKPMDNWMVRMVLAIAFAIDSREKDDKLHQIAQNHVSAALSYAEDVLHPGSISGVQAILLLVQYSMLDADSFSCWHLMGFASRVMVDLGLHREPAPEFTISKAAIETRRRVFYCVYTLDRYISMALGRPFSFTDDSVSVSLPEVGHSPMQKDAGPHLFLRSMEPCLHLFDVRRVQSALYQQTQMSNRTNWPISTASQYTKSRLADLSSWFSSLPGTLSQSKVNFFRLESLYSQIVVLAPSCRVPQISELSQTLILEHAVQYVDHLHPITRNNNWVPLFTVVDAHRLHFVGCEFVTAVWSSLNYLPQAAWPQDSPASSPKSSDPMTQVQSLPTPPSPRSPKWSRPTLALENPTRTICCFTRTLDILSYARGRFGNSVASLHAGFERESSMLMKKLRLRQQELNVVPYTTKGPQQPRPELQMPTTPPVQEMVPFGYQQQALPQPAVAQLVSEDLRPDFPVTEPPYQYQQDFSMSTQPTQSRPTDQSPPKFIRHYTGGSR